MRNAPLAGAVAAILGAAGYAAAGPPGAAVVSSTTIAVVVMVARAATPKSPRLPGSPPRKVGPASYPSYQRVSSMLGWSGRNAHYYDAVTRPYLADTAAALLLDRRRIDLLREPDRAQQLLGPQAWPLVDPTGRHATDAQTGPEDFRIVIERLEAL